TDCTGVIWHSSVEHANTDLKQPVQQMLCFNFDCAFNLLAPPDHISFPLTSGWKAKRLSHRRGRQLRHIQRRDSDLAFCAFLPGLPGALFLTALEQLQKSNSNRHR